MMMIIRVRRVSFSTFSILPLSYVFVLFIVFTF